MGLSSPGRTTGAAVDHTSITDPPLRATLARLHDALRRDAESLAAEARLALIGERITGHLTRTPPTAPAPEPGGAGQLLDGHLTSQLSLAWAAARLDRSVPHLVRSFTRQFGLSPHAYVIGRRIEAARRLMLHGAAPADVATAVGFYDQAHFTRRFKRHTAATPPPRTPPAMAGPRSALQARTRRLSFCEDGRPSLAKMLATCFSATRLIASMKCSGPGSAGDCGHYGRRAPPGPPAARPPRASGWPAGHRAGR